MLNVKLKGLGIALPNKFMEFQSGRRYRISGTETHLGLLCESAENALENSGLTIDDIDVMVGACAVGVQPIPCTAALVHEVIANGTTVPAFDVNSSCTSFLTAFDIAGHYIQSGTYRNVLIISGDVASVALNEKERHSFELFSDGAVSAVVAPSGTSGILYQKQLTCSAGAHVTEIVGGGSRLPVFQFSHENKHRYQFHMDGKEALTMTKKLVKALFADIEKNSGLTLQDIDLIIPHQASAALSLIMRKLRVPAEKFVDLTREYGNMVSASVPFTLERAVRQGRVKRGSVVLLLGSAAGLTLNAMIMRY